jgi:hypothetical protein
MKTCDGGCGSVPEVEVMDKCYCIRCLQGAYILNTIALRNRKEEIEELRDLRACSNCGNRPLIDGLDCSQCNDFSKWTLNL